MITRSKMKQLRKIIQDNADLDRDLIINVMMNTNEGAFHSLEEDK